MKIPRRFNMKFRGKARRVDKPKTICLWCGQPIGGPETAVISPSESVYHVHCWDQWQIFKSQTESPEKP